MSAKIAVFFIWLCIAPFFIAMAVEGWKVALFPPSYMQHQWAWRIFGATVIGTLFPAGILMALIGQISWWMERKP